MERIVFDKMKKNELLHMAMNLHLQFYAFAHKFVWNKKVLDAACGTGFGSMIFSTAAKSIIAIDKSQQAIDYGKKKLPFFCPIKFIKADLNKDVLPEADTCISLETIEHLDANGFFLRNLKVKTLVYSIPLNHPGDFHTMVFNSADNVVQYLEENSWHTIFTAVGENESMLGVAQRV